MKRTFIHLAFSSCIGLALVCIIAAGCGSNVPGSRKSSLHKAGEPGSDALSIRVTESESVLNRVAGSDIACSCRTESDSASSCGSLRLSYEPFEGALRHSFTIATYSRSSTPIVHTRLEWNGFTAYGEAAMPQYLGETVESCSAFLDRVACEVLPFVKDPTDISSVMGAVDSLADGNKAAKASVDIALHDLLGKIEGQPLWKMWDIDSSATPCTSFTIGYDESDSVVLEKVAEASWAKILKVKLGMGEEKDKRMINLVRSASDVPIYVDANQGWKSKEEALAMIKWLAGQGVVLVEQPMAKELVREHRWIRRRSPLPIIADEACQRLEDIPRLKGVYDGINIKLMKCTGLCEARRMIALARELDMQVMLGCMTETSVGISAAAQLSSLVDYADLDGNVLLSNDNFRGVGLSNGRLILNGLPGIGAVPAE